MQKKKILVMGPVSAHAEDMASIANTLTFLNEDYAIDYLDSLSIMEELPNVAYYQLWEKKLATCINEYDAFFGFAFGGVIIQQCFSLFQPLNKPIILFSTPSFADSSLNHKLGLVVHLCQENKLDEALHALYEPVFYPNPMPPLSSTNLNRNQAYKRLIFGLNRVLQTDSRAILQNNQVPHLHLIGEYSNLVNSKNTIAAQNSQLVIVPHSSMRVLQDNPAYCQKIIWEVLSGSQ
ncbi:MAG: hypothetical protein P4L79_18185 [Legionella sp.]|uniref:hypothetical protein n=1 Tax=Legionella sp. TaxID=459 RepID=UPI00283E31B0|nr:hypothetical protein [Legionella sp.]